MLGERVADQTRAILGCGFRDVVPAEGAAEFVEQIVVILDAEIFFLALAVGSEIAGFGGDPELEREMFGRRAVSGFEPESGLAHATRPIDDDAPAAVFGIEVSGDFLQLGGAAEEWTGTRQGGMGRARRRERGIWNRRLGARSLRIWGRERLGSGSFVGFEDDAGAIGDETPATRLVGRDSWPDA
jgi:hypothetical protein